MAWTRVDLLLQPGALTCVVTIPTDCPSPRRTWTRYPLSVVLQILLGSRAVAVCKVARISVLKDPEV